MSVLIPFPSGVDVRLFPNYSDDLIQVGAIFNQTPSGGGTSYYCSPDVDRKKAFDELVKKRAEANRRADQFYKNNPWR